MNIIWIAGSRTCQSIWHGWSPREGKKRIILLFSKWCHIMLLLGKLPSNFCWLSLSFDNSVYCGRKIDQPSFLLCFSLLSFSLSTPPPTCLFLLNLKPGGITGQKSGENKQRLWSYHLTSLYQNAWRVAWHFPGEMYSYITSVWISHKKRSTELCNGHRVWTSSHYKLRSLRITYISARDSGPQEGKKIKDIGKNPHKVTSIFGDWLK